jgi:hypothetical protein
MPHRQLQKKKRKEKVEIHPAATCGLHPPPPFWGRAKEMPETTWDLQITKNFLCFLNLSHAAELLMYKELLFLLNSLPKFHLNSIALQSYLYSCNVAVASTQVIFENFS